MLLPSALSCDSNVQPKPQRPVRPKLPSFERYNPCQRSQSPVLGLIASCRALHGILGDRFSPNPSPSLEITSCAEIMGSPFGDPTPPPVCVPAPRGDKKRRRDEMEDDDFEVSRSQCREINMQNDRFSTPKRRRIIPLELPPGLQACDFEALVDTNPYTQETLPHKEDDEIDMPMSEAENDPMMLERSECPWSDIDDRMLVETVLSKLKLSSRDWNDCATQLGKDRDSLGRRWRLLLGGGNIGLRRGSGRPERPNLDIKSW